MTNLIQDLIERLTPIKFLALGSMIPIGLFLGMALRTSLTKLGTDFEKYNIKSFSVIDSSKIDTLFVKRGEFYMDTLIGYYRLSKKEMGFESVKDIYSKGFLSVRNKELSKYKLLVKGIPSEEIIGKNNKTKTYSIEGDFFGKGFKLNKLESMNYGTNSNFLDNFFNVKGVYQKDPDSNATYTRDTEEGKRILDNEQAEVKRYLEKILKYKKGLKD